MIPLKIGTKLIPMWSEYLCGSTQLKFVIGILAGILAMMFSLPSFGSCRKDPYTAELLKSGDGFRALGRMKEFEFQSRQSAKGFACAREIISLYVDDNEFAQAENLLDKLPVNYANTQLPDFQLWRTELAYLFGNYEEAVQRAQQLPDSQKKLPVVYVSYHLQKAAPSSPEPICDDPICRKFDELKTDPSLAHRKSVAAGTLLSILPGAGQMYAGRWRSGFASLVLNSFLIGLTIYASQRGENATALLTGTAGLVFYAGNFYAGYEATRRYNELQHQRFEEKARDLRLGLTLPLP